MADRRLQVFHAVARHGSFTRAAEALFMTQPAVTFQIKQLEEQFNTRLFDRGHGRVTLTSAGELVMAYAERILGLSEELESRVSELTDELSGILHLGTSTTIASYWLPQLLEGFKRRYPRVIPRVSVGNSQLIETRVMDRNLDVGLIEIITEQPTLDRRSAGRDELQLIVPPDHPLAGARSVRAEQLVSYPLLHREPGNAIRDLVDQFFAAAGIPFEDLNVAAELGSLSAVKHLAAQGFGVAIASAAAIRRAVEAGRLVGVPLSPRLYTPLEVILLKDKFRSRLVNTFADFVTEEIGRMGATEKA
ncbi:LysR family transcriptional regulator [Zoogloea sp.]|jgi:DNA-binding transcriptional LysR family regulator|uniref:LysR family transcriptional regulator n=1 Tax=Zoogloea sp. TaxID=49181 RepID=UPI0011D6AE35|nr:LysR family transcriptional regulator [Zoogloea sp.]MBK6653396.1 LysR family transcriptional regulator [Zoogloea sp.]MBP7444410.1 LysR family transcriptional regulator [Zoogloea sp.]TXG94286.1 MAG: LysR family transcriptional regulator [Zoogloea sp.]HOY01104.1 LysR family transcriptional regulator [Zoogloea sp.]HPI60457.1 LysR family transcriptional regulator [Zoogloea sp.]